MKTVLFICADETKNAGEREYMLAIAAEIEKRGYRDDVMYRVVKVGQSDDQQYARIHLPKDNDDYATIPVYNSAMMTVFDGISQNVELIGVGASTFEVLLDAKIDALMLAMNVETKFISHMVEGPKMLDRIAEQNITLLTPNTREDLGFVNDAAMERVDLVTLESVPNLHAKSPNEAMVDARAEFVKFQAEDTSGKLSHIVESGYPFAFVVVNAGFPVGEGEDKEWASYTKEEAEAHGRALGQQMEAGTNLVIVEGGPRNGRDTQETGNDNLASFRDAFIEAQEQKGGEPVIVEDRFRQGCAYNAITAGYAMTQLRHCAAYISNSEGYGTMDGAIRLIDNEAKLLSMFLFAAQYADQTHLREANINKYNRLGVDYMVVDTDGHMHRIAHSKRLNTPVSLRGGAEHVVSALGLASEKGPRAVAAPGARPLHG